MEIEFTIQIMAPDEELERAGECYAIYTRKLKIDYVPQIGTILSFKSNLVPADPRQSEYADLVHNVDNSTCQFEVGKVFMYVDCNNNLDIKLRAIDIFESSLERFRKLGKLLTEFYNFDRIV